MIVTHNGRLIHTLKLPYNLLEVTNLEHDPLRHTPQLRDGSQWSRDVRWQEEGAVSLRTPDLALLPERDGKPDPCRKYATLSGLAGDGAGRRPRSSLA